MTNASMPSTTPATPGRAPGFAVPEWARDVNITKSADATPPEQADSLPSIDDGHGRVLHTPFSWTGNVPERARGVMGDAEAGRFAGAALDVSRGVRDLLGILEQEGLDECCADEHGDPIPRLVCSVTSGNLMRLCITSLDLLAHQAESLCDKLSAAYQPEVAP